MPQKPNPPAMIRVSGLRKVYDGKTAIDDVSFEIGTGEIVGLLGLNGAGKSTVLKIFGAMLLPTSGKASVGGHSVEDDPHAVRKLIGYLPDQPPLYDEMPVRTYLEYVAGLKGLDCKSAKAAADTAIERTNLSEVAWTPLGSLSHGYRQRAGIAQAIVHNPKVVILDEPINGLDPLQIVEMRDLINSLRSDHTVILSSHILSEITRTCDRILIIDRGRVTAQGSEKDLRERIQARQLIHVELAAGKGDDERTVQSLIGNLEHLRGISNIDQRGRHLTIQTTEDNRPMIAKTIVDSGVGLAGLHRQDDGLESLFMKLVQSSADPHMDSNSRSATDHLQTQGAARD